MNNISYTGIVNILSKKQILSSTYNSATPLFLNTICETLRGGTTAINKVVPCYISILNKSDSCEASKFEEEPDYQKYSDNALIIQPLSIVSKFVENNTILFSSMLSSNLVNTSVYSASNTDGYAVLLNQDRKILAYSSLELNKLQNVLSTSNVQTQATIEWKLNFANSKS